MPTMQRSLLDGELLPILPDSPLECVGGCGTFPQLYPTPEGSMCAQCIDDLYVTCADCGKLLRVDKWGECSALCTGPDGKNRCDDCDTALFSMCTCCGRRSFRENDNVRTDPNNPANEYCRSCWDTNWFLCGTCDDIFSMQDAHYPPREDTCLCVNCFEQNYFLCSCCHGAYNLADMLGWSRDPYCSECFGRADTWRVQPWSGKATTFDRVGSERCFGVEIETECCDSYRDLHGQTEWGCVYECSTPGREFISPILQGDEGFAEIRKICDIASENRWTVNQSCGLHIHLDARDLSSNEILRAAYAYRRTYPLWRRFVSERRASNSMCGSPQYRSQDVRDMEHAEDFAESRDRFEFVNWRALLCHGSIEVRLYRGSLNAREICNWIALHTRFIDAVKGMTFDEIDEVLGAIGRTNWRGLISIIDDSNLLDYWRRIASRYGNTLPALWKGEAEEPEAEEPEAEEPEAEEPEAEEPEAEEWRPGFY